MKCYDYFVLRVWRDIDAEIRIPYPYLRGQPGMYYSVPFTYVVGWPNASAFEVQWTTQLGDGLRSKTHPSSRFHPSYPYPHSSIYTQVHRASLYGRLPWVRGIQYTGTIIIKQA